MNTYLKSFFSVCPVNGVRISYSLRIDLPSDKRLMVEEITEAVQVHKKALHEDIADTLICRLGGVQTLTAEHHGVTIETTRP